MIRARTGPPEGEAIQGNILRSYKHDHAGYLFVGVPEGAAERGRAFLAELVDEVTTERIPGRSKPPSVTLNVALTCPGLLALGVPDDPYVRSFSPAFRAGLASRIGGPTEQTADNRPEWLDQFKGPKRHVLLMVHAEHKNGRDNCAGELRTAIQRHDLVEVHYQVGDVIQTPPGEKNEREHFGFSDGLSQPAVRHTGNEKAHPQIAPPTGLKKAKTAAQRVWRPLEPGEFILGYAGNDGLPPPAPRPPLGDNGTYMVYLHLQQHVSRFRSFIRDAAAAHGMPEELLAAKIIGRWRDGTPLVSSPDRQLNLDGPALNEFRYDADPDGFACPLGAHIRRTNPRDALGWEDRRTRNHRIIRRGMPYGDPLPKDSTTDDGMERGLIFVGFNSSLERQFETIQHDWSDDGNLFGLGDEPDFLLTAHDGTKSMTVQGEQPVFLTGPKEPFVTLRGGDYLFVPGIKALRALAAGFPP